MTAHDDAKRRPSDGSVFPATGTFDPAAADLWWSAQQRMLERIGRVTQLWTASMAESSRLNLSLAERLRGCTSPVDVGAAYGEWARQCGERALDDLRRTSEIWAEAWPQEAAGTPSRDGDAPPPERRRATGS